MVTPLLLLPPTCMRQQANKAVMAVLQGNQTLYDELLASGAEEAFNPDPGKFKSSPVLALLCRNRPGILPCDGNKGKFFDVLRAVASSRDG